MPSGAKELLERLIGSDAIIAFYRGEALLAYARRSATKCASSCLQGSAAAICASMRLAPLRAWCKTRMIPMTSLRKRRVD